MNMMASEVMHQEVCGNGLGYLVLAGFNETLQLPWEGVLFCQLCLPLGHFTVVLKPFKILQK